MRIMLKLVLDCPVDAAWRALHSPRAVAELYGPMMQMEPLESSPPTSYEPGMDVPVQLLLAGVVPMGRQFVHIEDLERTDGHGRVRVMRDSGIPLTGPLATLDVWDHQMAVAPAPGEPEKTLWRDRLVIGGLAAPLLWPALWATWQYRALRLRALAPTWTADDPPRAASDPDAE